MLVYTSVITSCSAGQIFFVLLIFYAQILLIACLMVANLVRVESRFATVPQSGPCVHAVLQVVTQSTHNFNELFHPVGIERPNLRL